ncbi:hypothetical protein TNCV_2940541 [Trichonephila clavipes]|nr:hypothetical protein TNCV_2940541 [Trichonephila clavipes]
MSSRWCGVEVRKWCQLRRRPRHLTMVQNYVVRRQEPRVAEQCDVNIQSINLVAENWKQRNKTTRNSK